MDRGRFVGNGIGQGPAREEEGWVPVFAVLATRVRQEGNEVPHTWMVIWLVPNIYDRRHGAGDRRH